MAGVGGSTGSGRMSRRSFCRYHVRDISKPPFLPTYTEATNQYSGFPSSERPNYDGDGNLTNDGEYTYTWDAEGRQVTINSGFFRYTYDALGRWVQRQGGNTVTLQYVYGTDRSLLAVGTGQSVVNAYLHLPGGAVAYYDSNGLGSYWHPDWLGSSRLYTNPQGKTVGDVKYGPFGEFYTGDVPLDGLFTGVAPSTEASDIRNFPARGLQATQGRWLSPDPAGLGAVDPSNPQTWNRYAYVGNNPLGSVDPTGTKLVDCSWDGCPGLHGGAGGGAIVDGVPQNIFNDSGLGSNALQACPNGDCSVFTQQYHSSSGSQTYSLVAGVNGLVYINNGDGEEITGSDAAELGLPSFGAFSGPPNNGTPAPNNGEPPSACLIANINAVNTVSNLNVNLSNVVNQPFIFNGGLDVNFSVPGASPSQLPAGRYASSALTRILGIGHSLHVPGPGGADPSTYGTDPATGNFTFTTHIDTAYSTWHTPIGAIIHYFVDYRDKGAHRGPC